MKIAVLGLGESLSGFKTDGYDLTIGVNDIWARVQTDIVVCVDKPEVFNEDRIETIIFCKPSKFYTHIETWELFREINRIYLQNVPSKLASIHNLPHSNNSTYVAAVMAYWHGANQIDMYGVDFINHPKLSRKYMFEKATRDFKELRQLMAFKGVQLNNIGNPKMFL